MVDDLMVLAQALGTRLAAAGWRLVTAESCTGGGLAAAVTEVAGSSAWFDRGFVTYSNEAKVDLLGVSAQALSVHGAVSEATVLQMARGALAHSRAQLAIAVSGIAGPGGGTPLKPVGTVWIAWATREEATAQRFLFEGDRAAIRRQAVEQALRGAPTPAGRGP